MRAVPDFVDAVQAITIVRRHHPLFGQRLEIWQASRRTLIVTLPDSSRTKLPRAWTDIDGTPPASELGSDGRFTVGGLREVLDLVKRLRARL